MNHDNAFKIAVEETKKQGFYFKNPYIYKYDFKQDAFNIVSEDDLLNAFKKSYLNQFDNSNNAGAFVIDDIIKELPNYRDIENKFRSYKQYKKMQLQRINFNELEKELEHNLKKYEKMKEPLKYATFTNEDILFLINNDIFTDGTKNRNGYLNLYKYDHKNKKFILADYNNISNLINLSGINPNWFLIEVPYMILNPNTPKEKSIINLGDIISRFNKYYEVETILKNTENSFNEINELINTFKV